MRFLRLSAIFLAKAALSVNALLAVARRASRCFDLLLIVVEEAFLLMVIFAAFRCSSAVFYPEQLSFFLNLRYLYQVNLQFFGIVQLT